jgi:hypothetical protein
MAIFGNDLSTNPYAVDVPPFRVFVAALITPGANPTWGEFEEEPRLKVIEMFRGSSIAGQSYATVQFVPAPPDGDGDILDVEDAGTVLLPGMRVRICVGDDDTPRCIWAGYAVRVSLSIAEGQENATWRLAGPEWLWGAEGNNTGASLVFDGQGRRLPAADDAYQSDTTTITDFEAWEVFTDLPPVFNPDGRKNMALGQSKLTAGSDPLLGHVFEEPDRQVIGADVAGFWTIREALKYLTSFGVTATGIAAPDLDTSAIPADAVVESVNVDGLSLWEALKAVCGPQYAFIVDTRPADGQDFAGFKLTFFSRSESLGADAILWLDERFTNAVDATACITRLDATKDTTKIVNDVTVYGTRLRHVVLRYHGFQTVGLATAKKPLCLQHGWTKADGNLEDFAGVDNAIDAAALDATGIDTWQENYVTTGSNFAANRHVFRLFVWNESREWRNLASPTADEQPHYTGLSAATSQSWYMPDLAGLLGSSYPIRRRPFRDTLYPDGSPDSYRRLRPTVFIAYNKADTPNSTESLSPWLRLPTNTYQIDPDRGALWITREDLATWYPFIDLAADEILDAYTFATHLLQGRLRIAVECCVEADDNQLGHAGYDGSGGIPLARLTTARAPANFLKADTYNDGQGFIITSLSPEPIDDSARAADFARQARDRARDAQFHASILVTADWPEQAIGKFIRTIGGRGIPMDTGTGRGAQIVAMVMDPETMNWELLTESAALALKAELRKKPFGPRRRVTAMNLPAQFEDVQD